MAGSICSDVRGVEKDDGAVLYYGLGNARLLLQHPMVILLGVNETLNGDATLARPVGNQVVGEATNRLKADIRVFALAHFAGRAHFRHFRQLAVRRLNGFPKALCHINAGSSRYA